MSAPSAIRVFDWLALLYGDMEEGWLSAFALDRERGARYVDWRPVTDLDGMSDVIAARADSCDVWLGVATRRERLAQGQGRGGDDLCAQFPGLWLDVDIDGDGHKGGHTLPPTEKAAHALIAMFPVPPTAVVHSGGGLQAWWLFDEPCAAEDVAPVLPRWFATWEALAADQGWHVDNVFDLARIMRVPGTANRKLNGSRDVTIIAETEHRYGLGDLDELLHDPPAPAPTAPARETYTGPERPGDVFNREHAAGEILTAHGWTLGDTDPNGDQQWVRPGKDARQGTSATVYAEDGHCTIWSDTVPTMWPTLECRRPYDAFGLWVHMEHGGDWRKASDELAARGVGTKPKRDDLSWLPPPTSPAEMAAAPPPESDDDPEATPGSSWRATDVATLWDGLKAGTIDRPTPSIGRFADSTRALYYPGRVNGLYGESGLGKSWIALAIVAEVLADGGTVAWIDLEEPAEGILSRLMDLGVEKDAVVDRLLHFAPEEPMGLARAMFEALDANPPSLVVIDSTGEALAVDGSGPNEDDEVARWFGAWGRRFCRRYQRTECAVLVIDHVIKDESSRGLFPGGSQRKRAAITGSAFMAVPAGGKDSLGRGIVGALTLLCAKDRHGHHPRAKAAALFTLDGTKDIQTWSLSAPLPERAESARTDDLKAKIAGYVKNANEATPPREPSGNDIVEAFKGTRASTIRDALAALVGQGCIRANPKGSGPRAGFGHQWIKPYVSPEEGGPDPLEPCRTVAP